MRVMLEGGIGADVGDVDGLLTEELPLSRQCVGKIIYAISLFHVHHQRKPTKLLEY